MSDIAPKKRRVSPRYAVAKGKVFERELVAHFRSALGLPDIGRGFAGAQAIDVRLGSCDLVGVPELAIEAKRTEAFRLSDAMAQAARNAGASEMPVVINRRNRQSLATAEVHLTLRDFTRIYHGYLRSRGYAVSDAPDETPLLAD